MAPRHSRYGNAAPKLPMGLFSRLQAVFASQSKARFKCSVRRLFIFPVFRMRSGYSPADTVTDTLLATTQKMPSRAESVAMLWIVNKL
jgi:hypothetical protein